MIHFFRRLRKQIIAEKKFQKYLIYAIGEIFLVMIGILLALQFNNWNTDKENIKKERWYLINIVEDIEYQKGDLEDLKESYSSSIKVAKSILKDFQDKKSFIVIDSLNYKLNQLLTSDNFPNINNTYQELISSGQQNLIRDKNLSVDIIDYYLFCDDNTIDVESNNTNLYHKEVFPVFYKLTTLISDEVDYDLNDKYIQEFIQQEIEKPNNKLGLLNALKLNIAIDTMHLELTKETLKIGKELVKKIDDYLGITPEMINNMYKEE